MTVGKFDASASMSAGYSSSADLIATPRAPNERAIRALEASGVSARRLPLARVVEREAEQLLAKRHPNRPLRANVEFYTAVLLDAVHVPRSLFTAMFAASRVAGWCAHIDEQRAVGRLIRPASMYVGAPAVVLTSDESADTRRSAG